MLHVVNYHVRKNKDGKEFITLELQGDLVMVQSLETQRYYITSRKCSIISTFTEEVAKTLIGKEIPGRIERVACEPFEYTTEDGEVITLNQRWEYQPETATPTVPMHVVKDKEAA